MNNNQLQDGYLQPDNTFLLSTEKQNADNPNADRFNLLWSASNLLTCAEDMAQGLQALTHMIVDYWGCSFCRIFLLDDDETCLVTTAVYPLPAQTEAFAWEVAVGDCVVIADWPRLDELLAKYQSSLIRVTDKEGQRNLKKWTRLLDLSHDIQSQLFIPLRTKDKVVGLLEMGQLQSWEEAPFTVEKQHLAVAVAEQTAVHIDRLLLYDKTRRREELLAKLDETGRHIRAVNERSKLLQSVIRTAAQLAGCTMGGLYINRPTLGELSLIEVYGLPENLKGSVLLHGQGLIGETAVAKTTHFTNQYRSWPNREPIFAPFHFETVVGIPLKQENGEVEAILFVADEEQQHRLSKMDIEILQRFAHQAAIALQTSSMISQEARIFSRLSILHRISDYIQSADDLSKILRAILTGVTAGYGLAFNRAALLLCDETEENLVGRMGVGHFFAPDVYHDWNRDNLEGMNNFGHFLQQLENDELEPTPLETAVSQLAIPIHNNEADAFTRALIQQASIKVDAHEAETIPEQFRTVFQPCWPLAITPLVVREQPIGLLIVDNKFTRNPITFEDMELLRTFANTAALGIDRIQLLQKTEQSRDHFQAFYQASNALVMSDDPDKVWQTIKTQACEVAQANNVRMFIIDKTTGWAKDVFEPGHGRFRLLSPHAKAMQIMREGTPGVIAEGAADDEAGLTMIGKSAATAVGLPVSINGERIGVMWFYYSEPRHFPQAEIEALQLYVNQAAIAYENARRLKELTHLHRAAEALSKAENMQEVLYQIVLNACEVLDADSAAIFSYDSARNEFDAEHSVAYGIPTDLWQRSQKPEPRAKGTAHTIFEKGWVGVYDVNDKKKYQFVGNWTHQTLSELGVRSFQAIALTLGEEMLGVLYVNYNKMHAFFPYEQRIARTFANHAARALGNVELLSRLRNARKTAGIVANVSTLANLDETLESITQGLQSALRCDVVSVHVYDAQRKRLMPLPTVFGARYPERLNGIEKPESPVVQLVKREMKRLIVPYVRSHPFFNNSRFSRDEEIASCVAILLQFGGQPVGALFANYRQPHMFLDAELEDIELFANQAAVAIHNAQLYERMQQRATALEALHESGRAITSSLDGNTILNQIAQQACALLDSPRRHIGYTSIWLVQDARWARAVATYPTEELRQTQAVVGDVLDIQAGINGRRGVVSRVIKSGKYELIEDVATDPDYVATHSSTVSELVVPIIWEGSVIGAINVEHTSFSAFDAQDVRALEALAAQAAVSIHNSQLFRQTEEQRITLQALYNAGKAVSSSLEIDEILAEIVKQASTLTGAVGSPAQFSCLLMRNGAALEFVAAYPQQHLQALHERVGRINLHEVERFGVTGRAFKTRQPQLVHDVTQDPNYVIFDPEIRSELAVPIQSGGHVIGVINVEHKDAGVFNLLDEEALKSLAGQAAVAIQNAEAYRETAVLQKVSAAFAGQLEREEILKRVLKAAVQLTYAPDSSILFWDEPNQQFDPAYTINATGEVVLYQTTARIKGMTRQIMEEQRSIVIEDVLVIEDANPTLMRKGRRSMVGVPVIRDGNVTAVLHVYGHEPYLFQENQVKQLETLAGIAGVALTKVKHYEDLKETKGMVGARTALAWMGMASNAWRHNIEGDAVNIRNTADLLRLDVHNKITDDRTSETMLRRLATIHFLANRILQRPITPPLSSEEEFGSVVINDLLRERTLQLWKDGDYDELMEPVFHLEATENLVVWASSEWLRRALDLVIDNAADAMVTAPIKQLTITTAVAAGEIHIAIQDTGTGIPEDVVPELFTGSLNLPKREGHLGRGLLMVQAIMETYGGDIRVQETSPAGTTMLLSLPVADKT